MAGLALVAGLLAVAGCLVVGRLMVSTGGLNTAHEYALVSISDSPTLRAALGSVLYLVLSALLSLGVATAIRDTAVSIGAVLAGWALLIGGLLRRLRDAWEALLQAAVLLIYRSRSRNLLRHAHTHRDDVRPELAGDRPV